MAAADLEALVARLASPEPTISRTAGEALVEAGLEAVPLLVDSLKRGDEPTRKAASHLLGRLRDRGAVDALVVARSPFIPGSVVRVRPIAVLMLEDEAGGDEKLLTVPVDATFPYYTKVDEKDDLPEIVMQQIEHFFRFAHGFLLGRDTCRQSCRNLIPPGPMPLSVY